MTRAPKIAFLLLTISLLTSWTNAQEHRTVKSKKPLQPPTVDYASQLSPSEKSILDTMFSTWTFKSGIPEYSSLSKPLEACRFDADTVGDLALHILAKMPDTSEYFLVILNHIGGYELLVLQSFHRTHSDFGQFFLDVFPRGTDFEIAPFEGEGDKRTLFPTDCVSVSMRDRNYCQTFLLVGSQLKEFNPCD